MRRAPGGDEQPDDAVGAGAYSERQQIRVDDLLEVQTAECGKSKPSQNFGHGDCPQAPGQT